ncbi:uncharacterized protein FIBRA_05506 [Fibroporia radiculosa]|uniref:Uncharacterized protein n=1 Tax=Fibroporia radiculosa TaxID=599839 RepID=J4IAR6_9APHY|nr:uncharacterized protein FIBRA_05506 [Fibroporia radiculosa]CCM03376.1 predicted protein [Fibroporia radiculosa]
MRGHVARGTRPPSPSQPNATPLPVGYHDAPRSITHLSHRLTSYFAMLTSNFHSPLIPATTHISPAVGPELPELPNLPRINKATLAGIVIAISGNVVISLALNCQKLAHKKLEQRRQLRRQDQSTNRTIRNGNGQQDPCTRRRGATHEVESDDAHGPPIPAVALVETEPLLRPRNGETSDSYGSESGRTRQKKKRSLFSTLSVFREDDEAPRDADAAYSRTTHALLPVDIVPPRSSDQRDNRRSSNHGLLKESEKDASEGDYLRSKLWWLGFILMNIGELGNFISYAFAPASVVAPLGTFALIANCIFAPLMLKERFHKRDFLGILIAVVGAVTVVLSSNPSDQRLDPQGLVHAVTRRPFIIYTGIYIAGAVFLSYLSERTTGKKWVYVDVGLCALFGGFTVLSTKAISTLLTLEWFDMFTEWITYPTIAILLGTGIGQIRYLNRALMRFDSKIVVPTQFVMFNLSAIVGSAIMYDDFAQATFHQIVTFLYGCAATFAGVFMIAWASSVDGAPEDGSITGDGLSDVDDASVIGSRPGSLSRGNRLKLVLPDGTAPTPILRSKRSLVSMYGLSPAQRALLLNPSPRDEVPRPHSQDPERQLLSTPDSFSRRRTISWLGEEAALPRKILGSPNAGTRENSRLRAQSTAADRSASQDQT